MDGHRTAERRSVAYHRAIADRVARDPALLVRATARLDDWARTGRTDPRWIAQWRAVLGLPPLELAAALVADDEAMTALRQVSPFAGALEPRARWQL